MYPSLSPFLLGTSYVSFFFAVLYYLPTTTTCVPKHVKLLCQQFAVETRTVQKVVILWNCIVELEPPNLLSTLFYQVK